MYAVGGFVRDMLLCGRGGELKRCIEQTGRSFNARRGLRSRTDLWSSGTTRKCVSDIDLVTPDPIETFLPTVQKFSKRCHVTQQYQAVQFSFESFQVTLTRLRYDAVCNGRQAEVVFVKTLQEDVWRRDFTINALYADAEGQVIDFIGGYQDLSQRKIHFIGDPEIRIKEDVLRILRYVRFCSLLKVPMDPQMLDLMRPYLPQLESIAHSRLQCEIRKIKSLPFGKENLILLRAH